MKRLFLAILSIVFLLPLSAQNENAAPRVPEGYMLVDSLVFTKLAVVDSTLDGRSIFSSMPEGVIVNQSKSISNAMDLHIEENRGKMFNGYRIRIFFDNGQNARGASGGALYRFKSLYPGVSAYLSFTNPYFKVTVGDYRNKSDAAEALASIKRHFPTAFIIKERFRYPSLKRAKSYRVDTVKVLRKVN